jgi:glycerophosphoryl diester phosphodiesterase
LDGVEVDCLITKDKVIVLFHDEDMERLTGVKGAIKDFTWEEVTN